MQWILGAQQTVFSFLTPGWTGTCNYLGHPTNPRRKSLYCNHRKRLKFRIWGSASTEMCIGVLPVIKPNYPECSHKTSAYTGRYIWDSLQFHAIILRPWGSLKDWAWGKHVFIHTGKRTEDPPWSRLGVYCSCGEILIPTMSKVAFASHCQHFTCPWAGVCIMLAHAAPGWIGMSIYKYCSQAVCKRLGPAGPRTNEHGWGTEDCMCSAPMLWGWQLGNPVFDAVIAKAATLGQNHKLWNWENAASKFPFKVDCYGSVGYTAALDMHLPCQRAWDGVPAPILIQLPGW